MKFLIVEDSRAMQSILRRIVTSVGAETEAARDGQAALDILNAGARFDVALVDWNMPNMTGLEFVRNVRHDHSHDSMKIIMVTTETQEQRIAEALEAGANEYVMKPFGKDELLAKLKLLGLVE